MLVFLKNKLIVRNKLKNRLIGQKKFKNESSTYSSKIVNEKIALFIYEYFYKMILTIINDLKYFIK